MTTYFRGRVRLGGKGRFWCAACKSVSRTCSTSTLFMVNSIVVRVVVVDMNAAVTVVEITISRNVTWKCISLVTRRPLVNMRHTT